VASSSPTGCTGGSPVLTQSCTYVPPVQTCSSFTYSAWGACQSNNTQTRTVTASSPAGCTGGTPVLTQSCTYVPPVQSCNTCHGNPPSTGRHTKHANFASCATCHGDGYAATGVTASTHMDGTKTTAASIGFNTSTRTCTACHGTSKGSW
jgi:hypothetical protein